MDGRKKMSLGKIILKKRAVSPVIATILLIALTVTAAAIVYFVVVPLLRANPELVPISYGRVMGSNNKYDIEVRNDGGATANLANLLSFEAVNTTDTYNPIQVYIGANLVNFSTPYQILAGETVTFTLVFDTSLTVGGQYEFRLIYDKGKAMEISDIY